MKTLKSFKLFAVLFMAMFLGTSFTESASAQVDNDELKAYLDEICSQNEEALKGSGIISMNVKTEGSILSYEVLIDENMVSLDIFSMMIDLVKKNVAEGSIDLTYEEAYIAKLFDEQGLSFRYIVKGNTTGDVVTKNLTPLEMTVLSRGGFDNKDEDILNDLPVEDFVELMDQALSQGEDSMGCTLSGNKIQFEMEVSQEEYMEMSGLSDEEMELMRMIIAGQLISGLDDDTMSMLKKVKERGYSYAFVIKSGKNVPIVLKLDI